MVCTDEIDSSCVLTLILSGLAVICIVLNCIGVFKMCRMYRKIKFENYVLLSGIVESILFIIATFTQWNYIIQIIKFLQVIILLFITRRFLKIYFILEKKNSKTRFYNYLFVILVIINMFIIIILCVLIIIQMVSEEETFSSKEGNSYVALSHSTFSLISSITLFVLGLQIKKMIQISLKDSFKQEDMNHYLLNGSPNSSDNLDISNRSNEYLEEEKIEVSIDLENIQNANLKDKEIYFSVRIVQLNIVIITFLLCNLYQFFYSTSTMFFISNQFYCVNFKVTPLTNEAAFIFFFEYFSVLLPIFTNYIAFYFLIKQYYKNSLNRKPLDNDVTLNENDLQRFTLPRTKTDVDDFLN